jgi:HEPN domain-containing protein
MANFLKQYEILYNKANADLTAANILYARFNEGNSELDLEIICFHLQQCAEKLLKSILSKNEIYYPKVHDLDTLFSITVNNNIELNTDRDILIELNDYAVEGRYAMMHDDMENIQDIFITISSLMESVYHMLNDE